jgi:hypothetical protein
VNKNILHYQKEFEDTKGGIRTFHLYFSSIYGPTYNKDALWINTKGYYNSMGIKFDKENYIY